MYKKLYFFKKNVNDLDIIKTMIPVIINNRNRLSHLKSLLIWLKKTNCRIIILDNDSTYEPLVEYYSNISNDVEVFYLRQNLGHQALYSWKLHHKFDEKFFIYTDSDIVPTESCPLNVLEYLAENKNKYKNYQKIGLSLKIDDIPDHYQHKKLVLNWENNLIRGYLDDFYITPVDTTFAIYETKSLAADKHIVSPCLRTKEPYVARHMPWYSDTIKMDYEEKYYISQANAKFQSCGETKLVGMWTRLDKDKFIKLL